VSAIPAPVRKVVLERADGRCEHCGAEVDHLELHHRKYRTRGGKHLVTNLLALCGWGNHTGCHGLAHGGTVGESLGLSVRSWQHEIDIPVYYRGRWAILAADGTVRQLP
jgi:hypothetical protein